MRVGTSRAYIPSGILLNAFEFRQQYALVVDSNSRIVEICELSQVPDGIERVDCTGQLFAAAPILAHAHLESFDAPCKEFQRDSFSNWVRSLLSFRQSETRMPANVSAALSHEQLRVNGCGLVATHVGEPGAEIDSDPNFDCVLPEVCAFREVFAPDPSMFDLSDFPRRPIALHAPYSVDDDVARRVFSVSNAEQLVSIHLGEHQEEHDFLLDGTGELAELFIERGLPLKKQSYSPPVEWLESIGGLRKSTIAVHCSNLSAADLKRLNENAVDIVFCPGTHQYFDRRRPKFSQVPGLLLALGCDSRASNEVLDPFYELRTARQIMPEFSSQYWWQSLTTRGAEVLRRPDLGSLAPGKSARILSMPIGDFASTRTAADVCEVLCTDPPASRKLLALNLSGE